MTEHCFKIAEANQAAQIINQIVTEEDIAYVFTGTNFGSRSKREVVAEALIQIACDYHAGYTSTLICGELGLIGKRLKSGGYNLTRKGKRYLYWSQKHLREIPMLKIPTESEG